MPDNKPISLVGRDPAVVRPFLESLFAKFNAHGIVWAVMRGWAHLPDYVRYDVDFLVAWKSLPDVLQRAREVAVKMGWLEFNSYRTSSLTSLWFLLERADEVCYLRLDFLTESSLRGIPFLDSTAWLQQRIRRADGLYHLDIGYSACCILVKECLANGFLAGELRYQQIRNAVTFSPENYQRALSDVFPKDRELVEIIMELSAKEDWGTIAQLSGRMHQNVFHFRWRILFSVLRYLFDVARIQLFPCLRLFVAFVGPDGCGKTTVADGIVKHFEYRPFVRFYRIHSHFGMLPRLRNIKKTIYCLFGRKIEFAPEPPSGTHHIGMQKPLTRIRSMFYVLYYGIGLWLGRLKLLCWRSFAGMILADRYYYDYYYMRGHLNCPKWWLDLIGLVVPKPHFVFYLDRPAEEIYQQKPELDVAEIKRQQTAICRCFQNHRNFVFVDASKGVEETARLVSREIEKWLIARGRPR